MNLTKSDAIIFCGGSNDLGMNNAKMALRHITDFIKINNTRLQNLTDILFIQFFCVYYLIL
jgi:hypothetical protein